MMHIQQVTFNSPNINAQKQFFGQVLGFPIKLETENILTIQAGTSLLTFVQDADHAPYHYAFDIPQNQFAQARQWLAERVSLLADFEGGVEFHFVDWNAHAMYFSDADGNIAEFIARHNLDTTRLMPFNSQSIIRISEVGLVTPHVIETVAVLKQQLGIKSWRGSGSETFTAVGDEEGLLIVVRVGRPWLSTNIASAIAPLEIVIAHVANLDVPGLPYRIRAADTPTV
jgi:catechol-2,3-dioxygenase